MLDDPSPHGPAASLTGLQRIAAAALGRACQECVSLLQGMLKYQRLLVGGLEGDAAPPGDQQWTAQGHLACFIQGLAALCSAWRPCQRHAAPWPATITLCCGQAACRGLPCAFAHDGLCMCRQRPAPAHCQRDQDSCDAWAAEIHRGPASQHLWQPGQQHGCRRVPACSPCLQRWLFPPQREWGPDGRPGRAAAGQRSQQPASHGGLYGAAAAAAAGKAVPWCSFCRHCTMLLAALLELSSLTCFGVPRRGPLCPLPAASPGVVAVLAIHSWHPSSDLECVVTST